MLAITLHNLIDAFKLFRQSSVRHRNDTRFSGNARLRLRREITLDAMGMAAGWASIPETEAP